jgi:hypothetical protein
MFCSEFVIAAYQGAVVKSELSRSSALSADKVTMPTAVKLQAAHASPLAFHAQLNVAVEKGEWTSVGEVLIGFPHD